MLPSLSPKRLCKAPDDSPPRHRPLPDMPQLTSTVLPEATAMRYPDDTPRIPLGSFFKGIPPLKSEAMDANHLILVVCRSATVKNQGYFSSH